MTSLLLTDAGHPDTFRLACDDLPLRLIGVTRQDIASGSPNPNACPVALALQRVFSADSVLVDGNNAAVTTPLGTGFRTRWYRLPAEISDWIARYDNAYNGDGQPLPGETEFALIDDDLADKT